MLTLETSFKVKIKRAKTSTASSTDYFLVTGNCEVKALEIYTNAFVGAEERSGKIFYLSVNTIPRYFKNPSRDENRPLSPLVRNNYGP